jgi:hypothetical protein
MRAGSDVAARLCPAGPDVGPASPLRVAIGVGVGDLAARAPLPGAAIGLAQPGVDLDRKIHEPGQLVGGRAGPSQVAADDGRRFECGKNQGGRRRLHQPDVVQRDVAVPLEPVLDVPGRASVPPDHQRPAAAQDDSSTRAGSGIMGQSFHSRSSA